MANKSNATVVASDPDFNWDLYSDKGNIYSSNEKDSMGKRYEDTLNAVTEKAVTNGSVVAITKKEVVINIGYKSEGVVPLSEFRYNPNLKVGEVPHQRWSYRGCIRTRGLLAWFANRR
jgi:small subunit ribosomal protein S1